MLPVLMCVGADDIDRLFLHSVTSCVQWLEGVSRIVIVTPNRPAVAERLEAAGTAPVPIDVLEDTEVLEPALARLPSWCRQQVIKLQADTLLGDGPIVCLGADTVLLRRVRAADLLVGETPILYYNRYPAGTRYLDYEQLRVDAVARLLRVDPVRARPLGDFILDLNLLHGARLRDLRAYLADCHGPDPFARIVPRNVLTFEEKAKFGEWTLYATFLLDVLRDPIPIRNSASRHLAQVHSQRDLDRFRFDSSIVHFVSKALDITTLRGQLAEFGLMGRFR